MEDLITVKAKIKLYERGGRKAGIITGYRPDHVFEYKFGDEPKARCLGQVDFDYEEIQLGESKLVTVKFVDTETVREYISVGCTWWLHEGDRQVGEAKITELL